MSSVEQWWYFTFVERQFFLKDTYLKVWGTFDTARDKVIKELGTAWGFQYDEERFLPQIPRFGLREVTFAEARRYLMRERE